YDSGRASCNTQGLALGPARMSRCSNQQLSPARGAALPATSPCVRERRRCREFDIRTFFRRAHRCVERKSTWNIITNGAGFLIRAVPIWVFQRFVAQGPGKEARTSGLGHSAGGGVTEDARTAFAFRL